MIILRSDELTQNYSIREIAEFDTKAAILKSFDILNLGISKSYRKSELSFVYEQIFNENPAYFTNALPIEEQRLLSKLVCVKQNEYVEYPLSHRQHLVMQKLHLVLSYEAGDMWHIYMPDNIRQRIDKMAQEDLKHYPELAEFHKLLEEITEKRTRLYDLMDKNTPESLNADKRKQFAEEIKGIEQFYVSAKQRLKKLEPYLKKSDVDLKPIKDDITNAEFM
ncbi:MAG: hypothetical protein IJ569_03085, partial [Prevotella sp.]|nr:hypothetical protein [Prevotella sp.]